MESKTTIEGRDRYLANEPTFLGLPTELRLQIYTLLFQDSRICLTGRFGGYVHKSVQNEDRTWPILISCSTTYYEAIDLYWSLGQVKVYVTWRQLPKVMPIAAREYVQHLCLRIHTLSAPWQEIMESLSIFSDLKSLVICEEEVEFHPTAWRELKETLSCFENPDAIVVPSAYYRFGNAGVLGARRSASYECLQNTNLVQNRVLSVPLGTNSSALVPWTIQAPSFRLKKHFFHNFGNGKIAIVDDHEKRAGLQSVL